MERNAKKDGALFLKGKLLCEQNNFKKSIIKKILKKSTFSTFEHLKVINPLDTGVFTNLM